VLIRKGLFGQSSARFQRVDAAVPGCEWRVEIEALLPENLDPDPIKIA
jgi:hypothetical protein